MKKTPFLYLICCLLFSFSCTEKVDVAKEEQAIKATMDSFLAYNNALDLEGWANSFVKESYVYLSIASASGHTHDQGWDSLYQHAKEGFEKKRQKTSESGIIEKQEPLYYTIKIYDNNTAWIKFKIKWLSYKDDELVNEEESFEVYGMEKHDSVWKIAYISAVKLSSYDAVKE